MAANPLIGGWRLVSWEQTLPDGSRRLPFGAEPDGLIYYDVGGLVTVQFYRAGRAPLPGTTLVGGAHVLT